MYAASADRVRSIQPSASQTKNWSGVDRGRSLEWITASLARYPLQTRGFRVAVTSGRASSGLDCACLSANIGSECDGLRCTTRLVG